MVQLAIKGHKTRGKEVIQLLEMLGGKIRHDRLAGNEIFSWYYINGNGFIDYMHYSLFYDYDTMVFTLEEFEEKFPYKVGDKVITKDKFIGTITDMRWQGDSFFVGKEEGDIVYTVQVSTTVQIIYPKENLQPYKKEGVNLQKMERNLDEALEKETTESLNKWLDEENMKDMEINKEPDMVEDNYCETLESKVFAYKIGDIIFTNKTGWIRITNKLWDCYAKDYTYKGIGWMNKQEYNSISHKDITDKIELDKVTDKNNCDINCPDGYEFYDDNGNLIGNKIIMRLKKPQYPKTYGECYNILGIDTQFCMKYLPHGTFSYKDKIIYNLQELLICRDAYWKVAGEQMGLGKPWEYDMSKDEFVYAIVYQYGYIQKSEVRYKNHILAFPTAEMRDTFYENFRSLIEECKELLS